MKNSFLHIIWAIFAILLVSCHSGDQQASTATTEDSIVTETPSITSDLSALTQWTSYLKNNTAGRFDANQFLFSDMDTIALKATEPFQKNDWNIYRKLLIYSPDSAYAIDLFSYGTIPVKQANGSVRLEGGDPESEAALVEMKSEKRFRIMFSGPGTEYQDAHWLSDSTVIISGISEFNDQNKPLPVVWKFHLKSHALEEYDYQDTLTLQQSSYVNPTSNP